MREIRKRTFALLCRICPENSDFHDEDTLVGDLGLESIEILALIATIENEFAIAIDTGNMEPIRTIGDLLTAIEKHIR